MKQVEYQYTIVNGLQGYKLLSSVTVSQCKKDTYAFATKISETDVCPFQDRNHNLQSKESTSCSALDVGLIIHTIYMTVKYPRTLPVWEAYWLP